MNNVNYIVSTLLSTYRDVQHGITTKYSGISQNDLNTIVFPRQEHGNRVVWVDESNRNGHAVADGLLTRSKNIRIGIRTADCVPVLLYDPVAGIAGAVHSGWRGTAKHVVQHAVSEIVRAGGDVRTIVATIGPHIMPCCYVVGEDVASIFREMGDQLVSVAGGTPRVHLADAVCCQLAHCGLTTAHIERSIHCTCCEKNMFVSYRRDGPQSLKDQIVSYIVIQ